jgi:RsiW-degrading membrane proteinase PrsW (M82 family)
VFFKTFLGAIIVYVLFVQAWKEFGNINLVPGLIMVGSFAVPVSALIFFVEVNARRNVSLYQVVRMVFVGGIVSLISSLILFQVSDAFSLNWLGASVSGIVEEPGKLLALILVVNVTKYRYTLNGLLFGASVGAGFAAFESAGFALVAGLVNGTDAMMDSIMLRGMLSPFAHIVWTGMCGTALWKVKGDRKFQFEMLKDPRFLRILGIAIVMHMMWNSPLYLPFYAKYAVLGTVAWIVILALIQDGLKQLREEKIRMMNMT